MQNIRGTKDILPDEIQKWQTLYIKALKVLTSYNYQEIRTPILESTELFIRGVGTQTDIVSKEMYNFEDQSKRSITLRPEGTASIARAYISNKLYQQNVIQKLWYMGPMFRYERPQSGRQRQFHQLGIEYIGSHNPLADVEAISIATTLLKQLGCNNCHLEVNSLGTEEDRKHYKKDLVNYLEKYKNELDIDSQKRLLHNPLRILDSKNPRTQTIIEDAPQLKSYLSQESFKHFEIVCEHLTILDIPFTLNTKLVRGLDYYNHTAFEIINEQLGNKTTLCGGGRYNKLIKELGGPDYPGVGWAIGIERLFLTIQNQEKTPINRFFILIQGTEATKKVWDLIQILQKHNIPFNLDLSNQNLQKQIKKAVKANALACLILGSKEIENESITVKWLKQHYQETIKYNHLIQYIEDKK